MSARSGDGDGLSRPAGDLSRIRDGWQQIEAQKARLLEPRSVEESVAQWLELQRAFEAQLEQTDALFRGQRMAHLLEPQDRLCRLAIWMNKRRGTALLSPS